ncbi:MAG TPA: DUF6476 family protein [Rhizomicrobium sp.]|nr:DUF6476 family protein [Rhizomicrobium sp.]
MSDIQAQADPRGTATYRAARLAVIVLTALIILALIGLAAGMMMKLSGRGMSAPSTGSQAFVLPVGARIVSTQTQPGRIILQVHSEHGDEIDILSTDDGHLVARVAPPAR